MLDGAKKIQGQGFRQQGQGQGQRCQVQVPRPQNVVLGQGSGIPHGMQVFVADCGSQVCSFAKPLENPTFMVFKRSGPWRLPEIAHLDYLRSVAGL